MWNLAFSTSPLTRSGHYKPQNRQALVSPNTFVSPSDDVTLEGAISHSPLRIAREALEGAPRTPRCATSVACPATPAYNIPETKLLQRPQFTIKQS